MNKPFRLYGRIRKFKKTEDGTLVVSGIASSEAVDGDGDVILAAAMKDAIPDYMKFGAIREMHQPIAAGVALKCEVMEDGKTHLEAKIVDPATIMKIEDRVLKGFSIGGMITERDADDENIVTGLELLEISVVDRPSNPDAMIELAKLAKINDSEQDEEEEEEDDDERDEEKNDNDNDSGQDDDDEEEGEEEVSEPRPDEGDEPEEDTDKYDEDAEKYSKLAKSHGEALNKILVLQRDLKKAKQDLLRLQKSSAPPKCSVRAISKDADVIDPTATIALEKQAAEISALQPFDQAVYLIKAIQTHNQTK